MDSVESIIMNLESTGRGQEWLEKLFERTKREFFSDVSYHNPIRVEFGRRAKRRLGSISIDRKNPSLTVIRVNGWFRSDRVPETIVQSVLVHELCHYAHGFNSGAKNQKHKYPHSGGVIRREFEERGLVEMYEAQTAWIRMHWPKFLADNNVTVTRKRPGKLSVKKRAKARTFWFISTR